MGVQITSIMQCVRFSLLALFLGLTLSSQADPGDTTWVQTYTWEAQNNPATAYDSPGRRWFDFPSQEDTTYRKILMYHRLKCFGKRHRQLGFPCGEWDYLTYNYLFDHTGLYDSTALSHPQYLLNDASFEEASLILQPEGGAPVDTVWRMLSTTSHEFVEGSTTWSQLAGVPMNDLANTTLEDQTRHQWLWSAAELDSLGWAVGDTAWRMSLPRAGNLGASSVDRATLRVRWTATTALGGIVTTGWTTLADGPLAVGDMAWSWDVDFGQPLTREADMNLMVDVALDGVNVAEGSGLSVQTFPCRHPVANVDPSTAGAPQFVRMDGNDRMEIDPVALLGIDTTITLESGCAGMLRYFRQTPRCSKGTRPTSAKSTSTCPGATAGPIGTVGTMGATTALSRTPMKAFWRDAGCTGPSPKTRKQASCGCTSTASSG